MEKNTSQKVFEMVKNMQKYQLLCQIWKIQYRPSLVETY